MSTFSSKNTNNEKIIFSLPHSASEFMQLYYDSRAKNVASRQSSNTQKYNTRYTT